MRVNINGIFNVSSATMIEKLEATEEKDEPMEVEGEKGEAVQNGPDNGEVANDKAAANGENDEPVSVLTSLQ